MARLIIDSGHRDNPADPGAVGLVVEADRNIAIKNALRKYLSFEETPDGLGSLAKTIAWVNQNFNSDDVLLSLHTNAGGGDGVEIWYYTNSEPSRKKAQLGCDLIAAETGDPNRGAKDEKNCRYGQFGIIHDTKPWAFLIECDFVDDPTGDVRDNVEAYARGIARFAQTFGFSANLNANQPAPQPEPTPAPQPQPEPTPAPTLIDPRDQQISALNSEIERLKREGSDKDIQISELKRDLGTETTTKDDLFKKIGEALREKEENYKLYKEEVEEYKKLEKTYEDYVKVKSEAHDTLSDQVTELQEYIANHSGEIADLDFWTATKVVFLSLINKSKRNKLISEVKEKLMTPIQGKPGYKTTEFWLNLVTQVLGGATILGLIPETDSPVAKIVALALMVLGNYGYTVNRTEQKTKIPVQK